MSQWKRCYKCTKDTYEDDASWIILIKVLQILGMVWGSQTHGDKKLRELIYVLSLQGNEPEESMQCVLQLLVLSILKFIYCITFVVWLLVDNNTIIAPFQINKQLLLIVNQSLPSWNELNQAFSKIFAERISLVTC